MISRVGQVDSTFIHGIERLDCETPIRNRCIGDVQESTGCPQNVQNILTRTEFWIGADNQSLLHCSGYRYEKFGLRYKKLRIAEDGLVRGLNVLKQGF